MNPKFSNKQLLIENKIKGIIQNLRLKNTSKLEGIENYFMNYESFLGRVTNYTSCRGLFILTICINSLTHNISSRQPFILKKKA